MVDGWQDSPVMGLGMRAMVAAAAGTLLVGCSAGSGAGEPDVGQGSQSSVAAPASVAFTDCAEACKGEIDGAKYRILLPDEWNGTLLLYSHGYRSPSSLNPDAPAASTLADPSVVESIIEDSKSLLS